MSGLLDRRPPVERDCPEASIVRFDDSDAGSVFETLAVETARSILVELQREPTVPSDLAEAVDTSLQNVTYHLDNLEDAGLVEVVDHWYSAKGKEMSVYAPTGLPIVATPEAVDVGDSETKADEHLGVRDGRLPAGD